MRPASRAGAVKELKRTAELEAEVETWHKICKVHRDKLPWCNACDRPVSAKASECSVCGIRNPCAEWCEFVEPLRCANPDHVKENKFAVDNVICQTHAAICVECEAVWCIKCTEVCGVCCRDLCGPCAQRCTRCSATTCPVACPEEHVSWCGQKRRVSSLRKRRQTPPRPHDSASEPSDEDEDDQMAQQQQRDDDEEEQQGSE